MSMKVLDTIWFSSMDDLIGIVIAEDETTKERKVYIGTASGMDETEDARHILEWGNKFSQNVIQRIDDALSSNPKGVKF